MTANVIKMTINDDNRTEKNDDRGNIELTKAVKQRSYVVRITNNEGNEIKMSDDRRDI